jgi:hypothetical protein
MSRRRYKVGLNPDYDRRFDVLKGNSAILGKRGPNEFNMAIPQILNSIRSIQHYMDQTATLAKAKTEEVEAIIQNWETGFIRSGRPVPSEIPSQIVTQQLKAEAELDVLNEEVDWLKKELGKREAAVKAEKASHVLEYGPIGCGKGEPLIEVDGQDVVNKEGVLVISCKESPYDGMTVTDYFDQIVYPFLKARKAAANAYYSLPVEQRGPHTLNPGAVRPVSRENLPPRP